MKIICISGKAQHGKDFTANVLKEQLQNQGKTVCITHYADLLKHICANFFDWDGQKDEKGRQLLQYVGTDIVRAKQPNFWVDYMVDVLKLFNNEWDYVIIPDCRFPNEIDSLKNAGFDVMSVRVNRPDYDNGLTEKALNHPSETSLDDYTFDKYMINSGDDTYKNEICMLALSILLNDRTE